jgi:hypothetical protein
VRVSFDREGLGYVMRVPELATEMTIDHLSRSRGELHADLAVKCGLPGIRSVDGHVHQARFNLSSTTSRTTLSRALTARASAEGLDWLDLLEDFCRRVMAAEREGDPAEEVGALPMPLRETYRLEPLLPQDQVSILFGDGGTGKSTLAAAIAVSIKSGATLVDGWTPRRANVLYLDWEAGVASINRRVRGVALGAHIPERTTITYMNCRRRGPLSNFAEDVARRVDREQYGLVVVDSVGMASGTGAEGSDANESAIRLFSAFGYIGTTVLAIDHVNKNDAIESGRPSRPYGSIYKSHLARATYELRRSSNPDGSSNLGIYNTKVNDAAPMPPIGLRVSHQDDGAIAYERLDQLPAELTRSLSLADRISGELARSGHLTSDELADYLEAQPNSVRAILSRHKDRFNKLPSGAWELLPVDRSHVS